MPSAGALIWPRFASSPSNLWTAYNVCKVWGCRPSELYHIADELAAVNLDHAVALFGSALDAELNNVEGKTEAEINNKRQAILNRWIPEHRKAGEPRKFADPRDRMKR